MPSSFFQKFKRVTYSTSYLPEIDGLRFVAIFLVVVIMHITNYMNQKFYAEGWVRPGYAEELMLGGGYGVSLFFIVSGFILSLPFARWRLNQGQPVKLGNYYLRRLFRLEPPYIIALVIFFIGNVWVLQKYSAGFLFPRLLASMTYMHTLIYKAFPTVLPVAWTLEVEVQFYILAPLFCCLFLIRSALVRRLLAVAVIGAGAVCWFGVWEIGHVFMYLQFFFCGILLADLYCSNVVLFKHPLTGLIIGIGALLGFVFINDLHSPVVYGVKIFCMFILFHTVLTNEYLKKMFSLPFLTIIGGMCYSVYLMHFAVISFVGSVVLKLGIDVNHPFAVFFFYFLFITSVLLVSAVYFLLVEKPFMRPLGLGKATQVP